MPPIIAELPLLKPIPSAPSPKSREGILSLVSRAAGVRGLSSEMFCSELRLSLKKIIGCDLQQIDKLGKLLGLNADQLDEARSWSLLPLKGVRMQFRGEAFVSRAVMNPLVRGCAKCLREDVTSTSFPAAAQMAMRGHWQLKYVEKCIHHKLELAPLWEVSSAFQRYDYAARLADISETIMIEGVPQQAARISTYDLWLDARLTSGQDQTWLADQGIDPVLTFSTFLGRELRRRLGSKADAGISDRTLGFNVVVEGPEAISGALEDLAVKARGPQDGPAKVFGELYVWLNRYVANDDQFDIYRDLLREVILANWAIPAGQAVLGKTLAERRLHSVESAAKEIGRSSTVARQILEYKNVISAGEERSGAGLTFDAAIAAPVIAQAKRLVMAKDMASHLGATRGQFNVLVEQDILKPAIPAEISKVHWDTADADDFLSSLRAFATQVKRDDDEWIDIGRAAGRARVQLREAIDAARTGALPIGVREGVHGYAAVCAKQTDMDLLAPQRPIHPTLAEFALSVGLHKDGSLKALHEAGQVSAVELFNPAVQRTGLFMSDQDQAAFHAKFTSLKLLADEFETETVVMARMLKDLEVNCVKIGERVLPRVFLRADVTAALPKFVSRLKS